MLEVTTSELNCYLACPYKHHLRYRLMLRRVLAERPLFDGGAFHEALDLWYTTRDQGAADARIVELYNAEEVNVPEDELHAHRCGRERIRSLFAGYVWRWTNEPLELLASERKFAVPISSLVTLCGKIDKLVKLPDGRTALMEHKTTASDIAQDSLYWQRLRMDLQVSNYIIGTDAKTILYDVAYKPALLPKQVPITDADGCKIVIDTKGERIYNTNGKPRQTGDAALGYTLQTRIEEPGEYGRRVLDDIAARPDHYFARKEISRTKDQLERALDDVAEVSCLIMNGLHPRNTQSCTSHFSRCTYFDVCSAGGWDDTQPVPDGFEIAESKHEELEGLDAE